MSNKEQAKQALRKKAEEISRTRAEEQTATPDEMSAEEVQRLLHELRVHQIEIEMQNAELRRTQDELEIQRARYFDLYDLAPVGYCTVSEAGLLLEANLVAIDLLGLTRATLIGQIMTRFILEEDQDGYYLFRKNLFASAQPQSCELRMVKKDGSVFSAHLAATLAGGTSGAPVCRIVLSDISERKQAELELQDSEQRHRNYITNAPYGVFVTDEQGRYIQVNPAACLITGYNEDELLTMSISDLLFEETLAEDMAHFHTLVREEKSQCEISFRRKNGERRWWSVTAVKISDNRFLGFCNDISVRKAAEKALKFEKAMLARTEGIAHIGSWDWDVVADTVIWSDELFRIFQLNPEKGAPSYAEHSTLYHPDDLPHLKEAVDLAVAEGTPYTLELRAFRKDGEVRECVAHGLSEKARDGKVVRLFGSLQDITDSKRMEQNYQMLFQEMLDGFALHEIIVDDIGLPVNYRFVAVNPAFERMTGLAAANIIGHTVLDIMPDTEPRWIEIYGRVALNGEPVHLEDYSTALKKYFAVTAFRPAPGQFACVIKNVTEKKLAEEEKHKLQTQLQHAQKMEAIGTLAGGIAHDFNNILGAILGYAEMAQEDSPAGSMLRNDIDQVVKASHRAKDLVKQILAFSRLTEAELIPMQPAIIVREAAKMLRSSLPSTIDIQQDIDVNSGPILADPTQIHQIVMNLGTNALHAMEETGGTLSITLQRKTLADKDIVSEPGLQPGEYVQLSIGDTGTGIEPALWGKIFDPYFTTKEIGKGTGMGLSIIHGIVKNYGGCVSFHSHPGEGTVFQVLLPVVAVEAVVEGKPAETVEFGNERILFIDDEEILAEMGKSMLERLGYQVTVRSSSLEALTTFQNQPDMFDLVITDQTMPGMTGSDLARRILQIRPFMPIILCTGYSSLISEEKAKSFGIKGFAMKPLAKKSIAVLIREVLDRGVKDKDITKGRIL